jgi:hypothetical protein
MIDRSRHVHRGRILAYSFFVGMIGLFGFFSVLMVIEGFKLGYNDLPIFWIGLGFWIIQGYYFHEQIRWLGRKSLIVTCAVAGLFYIVYSLSTHGYSLADQFIWMVPISPFVALLRGLIQAISGKGEMKTKKAGILGVTKNGNDMPWPGGWRFSLREPIQRSFVRGFHSDVKILSEAIRVLTEGCTLTLYSPFEPPSKKGSIFEETIEYLERESISYKTFIEKHDCLKRRLTGEEKSIGEIAVDCSRADVLDYILERYWIGNSGCWFVAGSSTFEESSENLRNVFNRKTFPKGLKELVTGSHCFLKDAEDGEALLVVTDKMTRIEIREKLQDVIPSASQN